jgi:type IV pilus assembly protein PilV
MTPIPSRKTQSGSFILEALISVVIFAMGIIALIGMAAQAVNQVGQSKYRNDASYLAAELIGEMWVTAGTPADFDTTNWKARVAATLPGGDADVTIVNTSQVDIDISWADKEAVIHHYKTSTEVIRNS